MHICVDFDGTCVIHKYPITGGDVPYAVETLKWLAKNHQLILFTMRSDKFLDGAVNWFKDKDIPLFGINTNPTQNAWTNSPKAYGHLYIDDAALGIPLINDGTNRPYVDWLKVRELLAEKGIDVSINQ